MTLRKVLMTLLLLAALRAEGAMVRVVAIEDGRTLLVERAGAREWITLAGVTVVDEEAARLMLEWTLASRWISIENVPGGMLAYRSPDALFINRELVLRGFARATLPDIEPQPTVPVTFLGTLNLGLPRTAAAPARPRVRPEPAAGSGSGRTRRSPGARSPKRRSGN